MRRPAADAPAITAIMIFPNGEVFIAEAIESVLAQTFEDWELILVDDGSTDRATEIAKCYAAQDPRRIRYAEHPGHENRGMSASRNLGLRLARGEYVAFLDADDIWLPRRLEVHIDLLDRHPEVELVAGAMLWWRSWAPRSVTRRPWERTDSVTPSGWLLHQAIEPPTVAARFLQGRFKLPGICSVTARRKAVLEAGGFNDAFRTFFEDQVFLFRMCLRFRALAIDEVLDCYRQHPDSACNCENLRAADKRLRPVFLAWLQEHLVDIGCKDAEIWRELRLQMLRFDRPRLWWWLCLPTRVRDWLDEHRPRMLLLLTPAGYHGLRRKLGLQSLEGTPPPQRPAIPPPPEAGRAGAAKAAPS
ncbi:MAG: glycosyltransferase family 2 protein [Alphaproteobacteria bacterium]